MSSPRWRCPECGAERVNAIRLNHVHDGVVVPWDHVGGAAPLDVSGRFVVTGGQQEEEPVRPRRGRPRKVQ